MYVRIDSNFQIPIFITVYLFILFDCTPLLARRSGRQANDPTYIEFWITVVGDTPARFYYYEREIRRGLRSKQPERQFGQYKTRGVVPAE